MPKKHSPCIINLDDFGNEGTHWVCCFPSYCFANLTQGSAKPWLSPFLAPKALGSLNYFDSFGMPYPEEYAKRAKKDNLQIIYNTSQYQELTSVLCGYYCLFVLHRAMVFNENYSNILKVFNENNQKYNENLIKNYFKNLITLI